MLRNGVEQVGEYSSGSIPPDCEDNYLSSPHIAGMGRLLPRIRVVVGPR
jgi:hypothetical protein